MLIVPFAGISLLGGNQHLAELMPPAAALVVYLSLYARRARTLACEGRPVRRWRILSFGGGVLLMAVVQIGVFDQLADTHLVYHAIQHILIGEVATFFVVIGITGPMLQPILKLRASKLLRPLLNPAVALMLWMVNLYAWHVPLLYDLAVRHDLVHAAEHASFFWFGLMLWAALLGPLPKPTWFTNWTRLGYVMAVRIVGAALGNALMWLQTVIYPIYKVSEERAGLNPVSGQNVAGAIMMIAQVLLTTLLVGWLLWRAFNQDERRQHLLDLAEDRGLALSERRATLAAAHGEQATNRLAKRVVDAAGGEGGSDL